MAGRDLSTLEPRELVGVAAGRGPDAGAAWRLLVERHVRLVWKVVRCLGLSKEASEEAFQSTWLRAIERLDTLRDPDFFPGWLATIARREALAVSRAQKRVILLTDLPDQLAHDPLVGEKLLRDELRLAVREGMACLPQSCQDLLRLSSIDPPVAYQDIERMLGMSHGSIGPTRRRCLDKLRGTPPMAAFLAVNEHEGHRP